MLLNIKSKWFTVFIIVKNKNNKNFIFVLCSRENETDIGLRFLIPIKQKQKIFGQINYQTTDYGYVNKLKAKRNENQQMMPLVNIIKKMDNVLNSFNTNE